MTLWSQGRHFRERLGVFVCDAVKAAQAERNVSDEAERDLGPWFPDLGLFAAPVKRRRRVVGVVLGAVIISDCRGEAFQRLCAQCGLDRQSMVEFTSRMGSVRVEDVAATADLLRSSVEHAHELEVAREEIAILTSNLENTYEELNLVYRIGEQMRLPQKPSLLCERVGREVLEVSRAAAVGFVLSEQNLVGGTRRAAGEHEGPSLEDRVIQVGAGAPGLRELECLAESFEIDFSSSPRHILLNDAREHREFAWAHEWLHHAVALPLWHKQQLLGVLLAINCDDGGDFTSVDVQLFRAVADQLTAFLENQYLYDDVTDLLLGLLHSLVNSIDAKDPYTCGHSERVAYISRALARAANLSAVECERVYLAGLVHDVGKLGVPDAILCKPGKLTVEEFDAMKKHPEIGARILSGVRQIADLMPGVVHHHERMDGRGYPLRLAGREIPLLGRLICLGDCFDAMTTSRTYRAALPLPMAIAEIRRCSGTQFDPELAELFLDFDLERLLIEARECSSVDPSIGHIGALNAAIGGLSTSQERVGKRPIPVGMQRKPEKLPS